MRETEMNFPLALVRNSGAPLPVLAYLDASGKVQRVEPLYVRRQVTNAEELIAWAKGQGFATTLSAKDMHVTVAFSRKPVDWGAAGAGELKVTCWSSADRTVEPLGDQGAVVFKFESPELTARWREFLNAGASWDWPDYHPHITISYATPPNLDLRRVAPYDGVIELGPEIFEVLDEGWADKITEHAQCDYKQVARDLDALEVRGLRESRAVLAEWERTIKAKVTRAHPDRLRALARGLAFSQRQRHDLSTAVQELLHRAWGRGGKDARAEVREAKAGTRKYAGTDSSFVPVDALRWLTDKAFWITGVLSDKLLGEVKGAILNGIKTGKPLGDLLAELTDLFLPYLGDPAVIEDGEAFTPWRLETIIRTNVTEAYNHGRLTQMLDPDLLPFLKGVRYSAVMDERTTEVCRFLDGKIFLPDSSDLESLLPPNHFQCRSIIVPIVVGEQIDAGDFITEAEVGKARELADAKFLTQRGAFERYFDYTDETEPEEIDEVFEYIVRHENGEWVVRTHDGKKVLGKHKTKAEADAQLRAIEANKENIEAASQTTMLGEKLGAAIAEMKAGSTEDRRLAAESLQAARQDFAGALESVAAKLEQAAKRPRSARRNLETGAWEFDYEG